MGTPITSSRSSSATIQNDRRGDNQAKNSSEDSDFHYVSDHVRTYHSLLLQASDALSEDPDSCREQCHHLLSQKDLTRIVRCGALYLLAACSLLDSHGAFEYLDRALVVCDEMDEVNKAERVAVDAVPCKRVEAMRKQIQTLEAKLTRQYKVVRWQGGLANVGEDIGKSLTIAKPSRPRNTGQSASDAGADNHAKEEADNNDTDSQSTFNYATPLSHNTKSLPLVDACHIAELAFDLRCAQDEEKKAIRVRKECERQVILARKKREGIEEKLRRVEGLQKRRADFVGLGRRVE